MGNFRASALCILSVGVLTGNMVFAGPTYNVQTLATGAAVGGTQPDSVVFGDGSLWVSYTNGSDSTGASGSSTVVRYTPSGTVQHTWTIGGNVDGLRIDPTGSVWALQNNDANAGLTVINPTTNGTKSYQYGSSIYNNPANRGFDDATFLNGTTFLSETNPVTGSDAVVLKVTSGLNSPITTSSILSSTFTGTNLATGTQMSTTIADSDSLILVPGGELALTGEADREIVFIHNPGAANQYETFINLLGTDGKTIAGKPDDTLFPTAAAGFFYIADTGGNSVYRVTANGLAPGSVYIDVGDEFGILDTSTGIVTPVFTGVSPHGGQFVTFDAAGVPEPATIGYAAAAGLFLVGASLYKRRSRA